MSRIWKPLSCAAIVAGLFSAGPGRAATDPLLGDWITQGGGARVQVAACPDRPASICGTLVWLKTPSGAPGAAARDTKNPNPTLRNRPLIGLTLISGFHPAGPGRWVDGHIYDPGSGKTYGSKLTLRPDGTLKVDGCVLVICVAQTWTRPT